MPGDEFDQYKVQAPAQGDEFAQYKVPQNAPGTITGNTATISAAPSQPEGIFQKYAGSFFERAASQFGQDLQDPKNLIPSPWSLVGMTESPLTTIKNAVNVWKNGPPPQGDPAEQIGHMGIPLLTALVTHAGDLAGNPMQAAEAPAARVPGWKQAGTTPTTPGFDWQGSTPEQIRAQLQRMADRPKPSRVEGQPAETPQMVGTQAGAVRDTSIMDQLAKDHPEWSLSQRLQEAAKIANPQASPYQVVQIPAGKTALAVGPAYPGRINVPMESPSGGGSGTIDLHGYDPASQTMKVQFKNGNVYELRGVPQEIFNNYKNAESQGSFYQQNLKGRYDTRLVGKIGKQSAGAKVREALGGQQ